MTWLLGALLALFIGGFLLLMLVPLWILLTALAVIYLGGFLLTMIVNLAPLGMVTFGLALLRSLVWPIWITTGWPRGAPLPMD